MSMPNSSNKASSKKFSDELRLKKMILYRDLSLIYVLYEVAVVSNYCAEEEISEDYGKNSGKRIARDEIWSVIRFLTCSKKNTHFSRIMYR